MAFRFMISGGVRMHRAPLLCNGVTNLVALVTKRKIFSFFLLRGLSLGLERSEFAIWTERAGRPGYGGGRVFWVLRGTGGWGDWYYLFLPFIA